MLRFSSRTFSSLWVGTLVVSLLTALLLPITLDEAYYAVWSQHLSVGYFDHPPAVAFVSAISSLIHSRLGTLLLGLASLILAAKLFWLASNKDKKAWLVALILFKFNVAGLASGFLTTPDAPLVFFWLLALHESYLALTNDPRRWLSAGLATGLGLLSKYTMVLIGPVFLIALIKKARQLKTPWPYLGGVLAFLLLLPNLYWNSQNGWPTLAFQMRRLAFLEIKQSSDLPTPVPHLPNSVEDKLTDSLPDTSVPEITTPPPPVPSFKLPSSIARFLEYLGGLLVLWGLLVFPLLTLLKKARRKNQNSFLKEDALPLFSAALWVPIIFYGVISLFTKVEANWSAIYMLAAAPILAPYLLSLRRGIVITATLNCLAVLVLAFHARIPLFSLKHDRILKETHGFQELAQHIGNLRGTVFADTYQLASMLRYYQQESLVLQWPGLNRPSEFTQNGIYSYTLEKLKEGKKFWLLSTDPEAPHFNSFKPVYMERIKDCMDGELTIISSLEKNPPEEFDCKYVHSWTLIQYVFTGN